VLRDRVQAVIYAYEAGLGVAWLNIVPLPDLTTQLNLRN
jgi:hypothetical protein